MIPSKLFVLVFVCIDLIILLYFLGVFLRNNKNESTKNIIISKNLNYSSFLDSLNSKNNRDTFSEIQQESLIGIWHLSYISNPKSFDENTSLSSLLRLFRSTMQICINSDSEFNNQLAVTHSIKFGILSIRYLSANLAIIPFRKKLAKE